jgi:hypothetical protein
MRLSRNNWYLGFAVIGLIVALVCFAAAWNEPAKYRTVFYYAKQATLLLGFLVIPSSLFVVLLRLWRSLRNTTLPKQNLSLILAAFVLITANLTACGAIFPLLVSSSTQIGTAVIGTRLYRLDTMFSPGVGGDHTSLLLLWECDRSGLFCDIFYTKEFYQGMIPQLAADPSTNTLELTINSEVVYTYKP